MLTRWIVAEAEFAAHQHGFAAHDGKMAIFIYYLVSSGSQLDSRGSFDENSMVLRLCLWVKWWGILPPCFLCGIGRYRREGWTDGDSGALLDVLEAA